ncbi:eukaryotic translation elongation factor 1 epsilon-1 [Contarinia nasturtii]|uniref:eukaryotic translation elongation factor 1 epsilon-1 n=1 Tax=Contarinia nasturtii TaxID=265458 RepID=UPI0012D417A0|nr:eukaryotic translation elongation factor 1 epsilon-1 [Contarinia nasturtii]
MANKSVENIKRIAKYLKVVPGTIAINNEKVICRKTKDQTLSGYTTIISAMGRESKINSFATSDLLTQCLIVQWFDYAVLFIDPAIESKASTELVLQELNDYLRTRSYLVGQSLSLADVVVFYSLSTIMNSITPATKEKYIDVSRWFDHLQKNGEVRQNLPLVNLSTIYLHGWATGTHM